MFIAIWSTDVHGDADPSQFSPSDSVRTTLCRGFAAAVGACLQHEVTLKSICKLKTLLKLCEVHCIRCGRVEVEFILKMVQAQNMSI